MDRLYYHSEAHPETRHQDMPSIGNTERLTHLGLLHRFQIRMHQMLFQMIDVFL